MVEEGIYWACSSALLTSKNVHTVLLTSISQQSIFLNEMEPWIVNLDSEDSSNLNFYLYYLLDPEQKLGEEVSILSVFENFHEHSIGGVQYTYTQTVDQDTELSLGHINVKSSQHSREEPTCPCRSHQYVLSGIRGWVVVYEEYFQWVG